MLSHQGLLESYFQILISKISHEVTVLSGIAAFSVLIFAGVANDEIPNRLMVAAGQLEVLRSSLANWQDEGPGHEQIRSEALAFVDRGDLDSASEVLRRGGRQAGHFPWRQAGRKSNST